VHNLSPRFDQERLASVIYARASTVSEPIREEVESWESVVIPCSLCL
jgi:hypothetical protein